MIPAGPDPHHYSSKSGYNMAGRLHPADFDLQRLLTVAFYRSPGSAGTAGPSAGNLGRDRPLHLAGFEGVDRGPGGLVGSLWQDRFSEKTHRLRTDFMRDV
ncbi:hypothetical protein CENSYa_1635 [Cenarchaeum symbiosum A]|uniref:Uncharacterized protein n=1 Tax=Cenarchaeum symbiosum (strain A) TaxID=414004 RepID=A0RY36_CENSY|nr:hypothetical protein CENSYa_1635 [Cenarchaeum symbiosum A]